MITEVTFSSGWIDHSGRERHATKCLREFPEPERRLISPQARVLLSTNSAVENETTCASLCRVFLKKHLVAYTCGAIRKVCR